MSPKKRKAAQATPGSAKRVRIGESSIIGGDTEDAYPFGRPKRASIRQPASEFGKPPIASKRKTAEGTPRSTARTTSVKRGPGRPPKAKPASASTTTSASKPTIEVVIHKPRGRPRKNVAPAKTSQGRTKTASKKTNIMKHTANDPQATKLARSPTPPQLRARPKTTVVDTTSRATANGVVTEADWGDGDDNDDDDNDDDDEDLKGDAQDVMEQETDVEEQVEDRQYWLMKAEPESRMEKGHDVKFSIDDLEAANAPEAWDGVRNPVARNNMRAMREGDLAFFYHSNCKVPGIVGIMKVVREHSVDESAFDINHPYYDPKSDPEKPKWELVHVKFVHKFAKMLTLHELKSFAVQEGNALANMQMLKQSRLSVSSVQPVEWHYILELMDEDVPVVDQVHVDGEDFEN